MVVCCGPIRPFPISCGRGGLSISCAVTAAPPVRIPRAPRAARRCRVNPALGREHALAIHPAVQARHILVIGAGPAGMEAARVAALRGHQVTLCDASPRLGGAAVAGRDDQRGGGRGCAAAAALSDASGAARRRH
nr:NAD(P)/FAD-dependent oxidoreductase [Edwardsiella piscicida]